MEIYVLYQFIYIYTLKNSHKMSVWGETDKNCRHSLALAGQVVHARFDILIVRVNLHIVKIGLWIQGWVGLLEFHQLSFPPLPIPPLISDVLQHKRTQKKTKLSNTEVLIVSVHSKCLSSLCFYFGYVVDEILIAILRVNFPQLCQPLQIALDLVLLAL